MVKDSYRAFSVRTIGSAHISAEKPCQDSCDSVELNGLMLAVVADGHGGNDYFRSDRGSRFAVECFKKSILEAFCSDEGIICSDNGIYSVLKNSSERQRSDIFRQLISNIIFKWNCAVDADYHSNPFKEEEMIDVSATTRQLYEAGIKYQKAYGTTLIGIVMTDFFWFGIHIGDGKCVVLDNEGNASEPIPWDERCFLNTTSSICDGDCLDNARFFYSEILPDAIFVGSDGVDDSFGEEKAFHDFYGNIKNEFTEKEYSEAVKELAEYLPRMSLNGSHDDISIAGIVKTKKGKESQTILSVIKEKMKQMSSLFHDVK